MEKNIPIYFDSVIIDSPFQEISENNPNIGRLKVRVFTKYSNRNGSYITEPVADQLIRSATEGTTPVVGFFDPETQTWASHSGPTLANAYGYVEDFLGWEPFEDTDGIVRDYAVFSVILFTDYFEEAKKILGQNQSMELDPASITGDWTVIDGEEYFVYTTAKMLGFCVIGSHEPCFSVSAFFSKEDDTYKSQYEKFSSLLDNLKTLVEETEKIQEGGEQPMNEFENQVVGEQVDVETQEVENPQEQFENQQETSDVEETVVEEQNEDSVDFELLQTQFNELQNTYNSLQEQYNTAENRITELEEYQASVNTEIENLRSENTRLQTLVENYEAQAVVAENERKNSLIEKYKKVINEEEIKPIEEQVNDFTYDELESKLAIVFANSKITGGDVKKVPLPEPQESQFALLMKKYRKN